MNEIFNSDEMKKFEKKQFTKKDSYFFMQKAGEQVFKFINNNFKWTSENDSNLKDFECHPFMLDLLTPSPSFLYSSYINLLNSLLISLKFSISYEKIG